METKSLDRLEVLIKLNEEFVTTKEQLHEFLKEFDELLNKYRI